MRPPWRHRGYTAAPAQAISLHDVGLAGAGWMGGGCSDDKAAARALRAKLLLAYSQSLAIHSIEVEASVGVNGSWVESQLGGTGAVWAMGEGWEPDPGRGFASGIGSTSGGLVQVSASATAGKASGSRRWEGGAAEFGVDSSVDGAIHAAETATQDAFFRVRALLRDVPLGSDRDAVTRELQTWGAGFDAAGCETVVLELATATAARQEVTLVAAAELLEAMMGSMRYGARLGARLRMAADVPLGDEGWQHEQLAQIVAAFLPIGVSVWDTCAAGRLAPRPTVLLRALRDAGATMPSAAIVCDGGYDQELRHLARIERYCTDLWRSE